MTAKLATFAFSLPRISLSDPIERRSGRGEIIGEDIVGTEQAWQIRVTQSPDYVPGTLVTVCKRNVYTPGPR